ncbi:MAG: Stp1/IreP family PP2C-type Ser/Thr phosphatase [Christensenellales bacterium]|jgi:serine/threonine protein phosphatase PrpC
MKVYVRTDIGSVRAVNEDAYYAPAEGERFCCVADGMGGAQAGEVASAIAVDVFSAYMRDILPPPHERMRRAVAAANRAIYDKALEDAHMAGMGTTMTALFLEGGEAHIAHVGDSRAYLLRNRALMKITTDHTLVEEMVLKGVITVREAKVHPRRNVITRVLGTSDAVEIDLLRIRVLPSDAFLLCSDGLTNAVSEHDILEILNSRMKREQKPAALIEKALDMGGHDNITAMLVMLEEDRP